MAKQYIMKPANLKVCAQCKEKITKRPGTLTITRRGLAPRYDLTQRFCSELCALAAAEYWMLECGRSGKPTSLADVIEDFQEYKELT